jgi:signal peptidase I
MLLLIFGITFSPEAWWPKPSLRGFHMVSQGMAPTLVTSDRVWADIRPSSDVRRGDLLVVRAGADKSERIVRVVALPGDRVAMKAGQIILNGQAVPQQPLPGTEQLDGLQYRRAIEFLPGAAGHDVYDMAVLPQDEIDAMIVPAGSYFMLGDNRDNAIDSRFPPFMGGLGLVPKRDIIGRVFFRYWSSANRIGPVP